jgi:hypothetical protein
MTGRGKRAAAAAVVVAGVAAAATMVSAVSAAQVPAAAPVIVSTVSSGPPSPSVVTPSVSVSEAPTPTTVAASVLRVYSNNIENLVRNNADGSCTQVSAAEHLASMLVDEAGATGTATVAAPDLLLLQQLSGAEQAEAYADAVSKVFGYPVGTYRALVAWDEPEPWGTTHGCRERSLGALKKRQTNGIIYNTRTLTLADTPQSWSAGWLQRGAVYADGEGCTTYEPPSVDADPQRVAKWKRTTAMAAQFTVNGSTTTVFAASLHLPQQNRKNACAAEGDAGFAGTGISLGAEAKRLLRASQVRVLGVDANRTGIASSALSLFGLDGYGDGITIGRSKIDYLFVRGSVRPSSIGHTVAGTRSNHRALYGFIDL